MVITNWWVGRDSGRSAIVLRNFSKQENKKVKIKAKPEGRKDVWIPEKDSLREFILSKKLEAIHNFIPTGGMIIGADHEVESVLKDIDDEERLAIFTSKSHNMAHSLAIIKTTDSNGKVIPERLEMYDIGEITLDDIELY